MTELTALSDTDLRRHRQWAQGLVEPWATTAHDLVRGLGGVQAQVASASRLAVRARTAGLTAAAVVAATSRDRSLVRSWLMRGTIHLAAAEDLGWLVSLLGPIFLAAGRGRRARLGLTDDVCERGVRAMRRILADRAPLTREELVERLAEHGVPLDPSGQQPYHLIRFAALQGVVCVGPDRPDDRPTYVLVSDWLGRPTPFDRSAAPAELARRYLGSHGPASIEDFATWAGIGVGLARGAMAQVAGDLVEVRAAAGRMWVLDGRRPGPAVAREASVARLLPAFDPYVLGYRARDSLVAPARASRIQAGGGWIHPVATVDGRAVATWRLDRGPDGVVVAMQAFEPVPPEARAGLEAETLDVGRFLGVDATLSVGPPVPHRPERPDR